MEVATPIRLKPSTVETVREQLEFHRWYNPTGFAFHFPKIAERGTTVEYEDITSMTNIEADSVRHLLVNDLRYARKRSGAHMARAVSFLSDADAGRDNEWSIRATLLEEALADWCCAFGLPEIA